MALRKRRAHPAREPGVRDKVFAYVKERAALEGWDGLNRPAIVARFQDSVSPATIYRWVDAFAAAERQSDDECLETKSRCTLSKLPDANGPLTKIRSASAKSKHVDAQRLALDIKARALDLLPVLPTMDQIATASSGIPINVMSRLNLCLTSTEAIVAKCKSESGEIRNAKLLLAAVEVLRRSLETAVKMQTAIFENMEIERFHKAIIDEIGKEAPAVQHRLLASLADLNTNWSGG